MLNRRAFLGASAMAGLSGLLPAAGAAANLYGPAAGIAKLDANENPYGPSSAALEAIQQAAAQGAYYVGPGLERLSAMILERFSLAPENLTFSAGSSGSLSDLARAKAAEGKILGPDLFWDTTTRLALRQGGELVRVAKTEDLGVDLEALYAAITPEVSLVQICNPNNPTGMLLDHEALRDFCIRASKKCTVLVDEAYNEITDDPDGNSMIPLIAQGHDVVVARTFSKIYGLAGLRVGYLLSQPDTGQLIRSYGIGNYTLNKAGVAAAVASFDDEVFMRFSREKILQGREMIIDAAQQHGFKVAPSQTSFVFIDLGELNANAMRAAMAQRGVLIRGIYQDYTGWSRVSAGLLEAVEKYCQALPEVVAELRA